MEETRSLSAEEMDELAERIAASIKAEQGKVRAYPRGGQRAIPFGNHPGAKSVRTSCG